MKRFVVVALCLALFLIGTVNVSAQEPLQDCVKKKLEAMKDRQTFSYEGGCTTDNTNWKGERDGCGASVCYQAPPGYCIEGQVQVYSTSAAGSEHSFGAPEYKTTPSAPCPNVVCVGVNARSASGPNAGKGWQKVKITGTIVKQLPDDAIIAATVECLQHK